MMPDGYWVQMYPQNLISECSIECKGAGSDFKTLYCNNDHIGVIHLIVCWFAIWNLPTNDAFHCLSSFIYEDYGEKILYKWDTRSH